MGIVGATTDIENHINRLSEVGTEVHANRGPVFPVNVACCIVCTKVPSGSRGAVYLGSDIIVPACGVQHGTGSIIHLDFKIRLVCRWRKMPPGLQDYRIPVNEKVGI